MHLEVYGGGKIYGEISSDKCKGKDLIGKVCFIGQTGATISGGVDFQISYSNWYSWHIGGYVSGDIKATLKRCYECRGWNNCKWSKPKLCISASASVHVNFGGFSINDTFLSIERCN